MEEYALEPGLLNTLRQYIAIRLGIMLLGLARFALPVRPVPLPEFDVLYAVPLLLDGAFLTFLFLHGPRRFLGRFFLPVALLLAAAVQMLYMRWYSAHLGWREVGVGFVGQFIFLLVPVILTAWQYRFRYVVAYSLAIASLQVLVIATLPELREVETFLFAIVFVANVAMYLFVGYIVSNLTSAQRAQRRELAEANRRLVDYALTVEQLSVSRERNRLARELHDTLAHTLSGLTVQLDALAALWQPEPPRARQILDHALATARDGLDETRRVLQDLRAAPLEDLGLALAIRHLAESAAARGSLALELDVASHVNGVSPEDEQGFYRVAQEALVNVVEHAGAQTVAVSLTRRDGQLVLQITDDGHGLAPDGAGAEQGLGLQGMRERAELMGGTLEVADRPGGGTVITLRKGVSP